MSTNRALTTPMIKRRVIEDQLGRCAYCNSSLVNVQIHWDHFIPFSYLGHSPENNWVASCGPCNRVKYSRVFSNEKDITQFCLEMIKDHGSFGEGWPEGYEVILDAI